VSILRLVWLQSIAVIANEEKLHQFTVHCIVARHRLLQGSQKMWGLAPSVSGSQVGSKVLLSDHSSAILAKHTIV